MIHRVPITAEQARVYRAADARVNAAREFRTAVGTGILAGHTDSVTGATIVEVRDGPMGPEMVFEGPAEEEPEP